MSRARTTRRGRASIAVLACVVAGIGLAGCTADAEPAPTETTAAPALTPLPEATPQTDLPDPSSYDERPELRDLVLMDGCEQTDGGWSASGTAVSSGATDATYGVLVYFTDAYSRPVAAAETTVTAAAGRSAEWSASTAFEAPEGTICVLAAVEER